VAVDAIELDWAVDTEVLLEADLDLVLPVLDVLPLHEGLLDFESSVA
jgi:hypothetical protein